MCKEKMLKAYIIILLYSSVMKPVFGRWVTLVADIFLLFLFIYTILDLKLVVDRSYKSIALMVIIVQIIGVLEILHPNINNKLYSLIEYRKSYFQLLGLFITLQLLANKTINFDKYLNYILKYSIPIVLYGVKQYFFWGKLDDKIIGLTDSDFWTLHYGGHIRSTSIFSGPFHYGMFCVVIFSIALYLFTKNKKKTYIGAAIVCGLGCYCSITRTNLICLMAVVAIFVLEYVLFGDNRLSKGKKQVIIFSLIVAMFAIIYIGISPLNENNVISKMLYSTLHANKDNRFSTRKITWQEAGKAIISSPIVGWGMGSAGDTLGKYNISSVYVTSHNMFLKLMMELGVLGGALYVAVILGSANKVIKRADYKTRSFIYGVLFCVLLNGMVGSTVATFPVMTLYWIIIALAMRNIYQKKEAVIDK